MQWIHTQHTAIMTFTTTPICIKQCKVIPITKSMSSRAWTAHARACVHYAKTGGAWKSTNGQPSGTETKVLCAPTGCSCCTLLYAAHTSLWITEPVRTCCWMMGCRVWAERWGTIYMTPRAGECLVSQSPKTHTSLDVALPRWFFGLRRNRLSSICTTTKYHKRVMVELHRSRQYWYIWMAVFSSTSASSTASFTGYSRAHQYMRTIHCRSCRRDCSKNVPFMHVETGPSVMSLLCCTSIGWLQAGQSLLRLRNPLLCSQLICLSTSGPITADRASTLS